ncbi:hypothetical protein [Alteromonas sp. CYL-A6]|uniref:hypothetical protein n=1 Tax=Alteromonas nitratireducens TaxID=3390813 RepID=UPI0034B0CC12
MKKSILSLALITSFSGSVLAASQTFQASVNAMQDATIAETSALHFGAIQPTALSVCTMDNAGAVSGDCDASDAAINIGLITVSGVAANVPLNVTVTGGSSTELTFAATYDINNATATHDGITDGTLTAVTTNGLGDDLTIDVYGAMTVDSTLTAGSAYTVDYTVDVAFQ